MGNPAGWGPSHQTRKRRREPWYSILIGLVCLAIYLAAWHDNTGGLVLFLIWFIGGTAIQVSVWIWRSKKQSFVAGVIKRSDDPIRTVRKICADFGGGVYLGIEKNGEWTFARRERAALVLGPPRSGKTSGVIIPALLCHTGPVVSTSTKPDVANATAPARQHVGRVWVFDPTGSAGGGGRRLRWSPIPASADWDGAMLMARAMTAAAGVGSGTTHGSHWASRAQALLGPFLHAAALDGRDMETVVDWVMRHELDEAGVLLEHERASRLAFGSLLGILNTEGRERASIFSAASDALQAYTSEAALETAKDPNFPPREFVRSEDTVYICAAAERQAAAAPVVCGLLAEIRRATYQAFASRELHGSVLFALDEVANIAPLEELPQIASEGGGQGLTLLAALQDLSQARVRWGQAAEGFLTLFGTKLILPGIADNRTLEAVSVALGDYDRQMVSTTRGPSRDTILPGISRTVSTQRTRVLSAGEVANIPMGHGLHLDGLAWQLLTVTPAHCIEPWARLTAPSPAAAA